jgi:2-amino-4-hydroxy-6-hydroxymethyldihydropteridine diphosphokinase
VRYWVGLGANLGDCAATFRRAVDELSRVGTVTARSRIYSSEPVGGPPQPPYRNAAIILEADCDPPTLLAHAHAIERALGRDRSNEVRWGPRRIDVDLLIAGDRGEQLVHLPGLQLPHPRFHERAFALAGVVELSPDLVHPVLHRPLSALLRERVRLEAIAPTGEAL